jgi:hypothetical protein
LVVVGVEVALGLHAGHADAERQRDHRREVLQTRDELVVAVGVGDRRRERVGGVVVSGT